MEVCCYICAEMPNSIRSQWDAHTTGSASRKTVLHFLTAGHDENEIDLLITLIITYPATHPALDCVFFPRETFEKLGVGKLKGRAKHDATCGVFLITLSMARVSKWASE